jgi:cytochrome c556
MSFFDSEVVRAEMAEISELQENVYKMFSSSPQCQEKKNFLMLIC